MVNKESKEEVLKHFLELDYHSRVEALGRLAGDEEGEPIDMFVEANMVMSEEQFREAKLRLKERGYPVDFVSV